MPNNNKLYFQQSAENILKNVKKQECERMLTKVSMINNPHF